MKGPPQGPRLHIDIPRVQLLIEDKEGIKQLGKHPALPALSSTWLQRDESWGWAQPAPSLHCPLGTAPWVWGQIWGGFGAQEVPLSSWGMPCVSWEGAGRELRQTPRYGKSSEPLLLPAGDDKATIPVTDTEFSQAVNPQSFCTGVSLHHPALIQNTGPLIDMSDIRPGTSKCWAGGTGGTGGGRAGHPPGAWPKAAAGDAEGAGSAAARWLWPSQRAPAIIF